MFSTAVLQLNIPLNMIIGTTSGLQQKYISGDFLQLLELPLLRTHINGCFRSVYEAVVCRMLTKHLRKQT